MNTAFIGLGSNIEPRKQYLEDAIQKLSENKDITIEKKSSIYETEPKEYTDQEKFLNMVIEIRTNLGNIELLEVCQQIEHHLGREKTLENGPRTIDLDILLYNHENRDLESLRIPHPRLHERAFVLIPLCEIAPHLVIPTSGATAEDLLLRLPEKETNGVVKWNE
ncbi:MAG TPA: 2-amino-4-hydroxy-6-hydroxymethyldihydropteridine diphosphokinase [Pseudogracilibacillus sp.]|nr:2-amino-4-hydroxy-6-hydroxymethyldihydropteridine diphosphokinase [Pseudogracilibacillus sp.]